MRRLGVLLQLRLLCASQESYNGACFCAVAVTVCVLACVLDNGIISAKDTVQVVPGSLRIASAAMLPSSAVKGGQQTLSSYGRTGGCVK